LTKEKGTESNPRETKLDKSRGTRRILQKGNSGEKGAPHGKIGHKQEKNKFLKGQERPKVGKGSLNNSPLKKKRKHGDEVNSIKNYQRARMNERKQGRGEKHNSRICGKSS